MEKISITLNGQKIVLSTAKIEHIGPDCWPAKDEETGCFLAKNVTVLVSRANGIFMWAYDGDVGLRAAVVGFATTGIYGDIFAGNVRRWADGDDDADGSEDHDGFHASDWSAVYVDHHGRLGA